MVIDRPLTDNLEPGRGMIGLVGTPKDPIRQTSLPRGIPSHVCDLSFNGAKDRTIYVLRPNPMQQVTLPWYHKCILSTDTGSKD